MDGRAGQILSGWWSTVVRTRTDEGVRAAAHFDTITDLSVGYDVEALDPAERALTRIRPKKTLRRRHRREMGGAGYAWQR